MITYNGKALEL